MPVDPLTALLDLAPGWDTYDARPVDPLCVDRAKAFLAGAWAVPVPDGGVQLEWHVNGWDLEVEFHPDGTASILAVDTREEEASDRAR